VQTTSRSSTTVVLVGVAAMRNLEIEVASGLQTPHVGDNHSPKLVPARARLAKTLTGYPLHPVRLRLPQRMTGDQIVRRGLNGYRLLGEPVEQQSPSI
jgi:hypothetical protein